MARLTQLFVSALAVLGAQAASSVKDLTPDNFDSIVLESGKPALVEFFAPWCGHCKSLAPVYEELGSLFAFAENKVTVAKVDADDHKSLGKKFGVQGFPTLKWFDGKSDTPSDYKGGRDLESLSAFITEKTGLKPKAAKKAPSSVEMMNDTKFKSEVGGDKNVLVAFTAPWCGHCKSLAPTWEQLATDYASEPSVIIAKVDAESEDSKATAKEQGITGFPTIKWFPAGSKEAVPYEGARSESAFVQFVNENAGTHRSVGGGLDAMAGTISTIDSIVKSVIDAGSDWTTSAKEVVEAAKASGSDKWSEYYAKVANKLSSNKEYAEKELARVEKILKKGGLTSDKVDDLTTRSNILRKFKETVTGEKQEL
ncbi:disulfide isomerase [Aulographum hederae CBS 113979]|uniref:protein disulfide-isomerase n=1 Tax=Aulographum hederae CBS 113979 TaxID=1176131 RepID=A0A6G1H9P7_9PEZI|nr:disulfide isomerase [Aulographum hederae CBS 113979]